jgi:hypothetical protein
LATASNPTHHTGNSDRVDQRLRRVIGVDTDVSPDPLLQQGFIPAKVP